MASQLNDAENLSRIREILFGEEMESVENQVRQVKDEITQIVQRLEQNGEEQRTELQKFVNQKISDIESALETSKAEQNDTHQNLQKEVLAFQTQMVESIDRVKNLIKDSSDQMKQLNDHSLELIKTLNDRLTAVQEKVELLDKSKLDKDKLARLFNRLADDLLTADQDDRS